MSGAASVSLNTIKDRVGAKSDSIKKKINIVSFITSSLLQSTLVLLYLLSGTNFICLSELYKVNKMSGTDSSYVPYTNTSTSIRAGGGLTNNTKLENKLNETFFSLDKWSFPYKNMFTYNDKTNTVIPLAKQSYLGMFITWLTSSIAYSYAFNRNILYNILHFAGEINTNKISNYLFLLFSPFLTYGLILCSGISGFITTIFGSMINYKYISIVHWITALFFGITLIIPAFSLASTMVVLQPIQLFLFFIIMPLLFKNSRDKIKSILTNNKFIISLLFTIIITINAFEHLNDIVGYICLGITAVLILFILFFKILKYKKSQ